MQREKRRRRKFENELFYKIEVQDWEVHVSFNDYMYMNLFDSPPNHERIILGLRGTLTSTMSKKVKVGKASKVLLFPSADWKKPHPEEAEDPIGEIVLQRDVIDSRHKDCLLARVSVPFASYELIRSYLTHKVAGSVTLVGSELEKRHGKIYYIDYRSHDLY